MAKKKKAENLHKNRKQAHLKLIFFFFSHLLNIFLEIFSSYDLSHPHVMSHDSFDFFFLTIIRNDLICFFFFAIAIV